MTATIAFQDTIIAAAAAGTRLRIVGGASKDWYGQALDGAVLDTRGHAGILAYEPSELVITARCGTPLAEIEAALAAQGQMLAFEPPHFGPDATLGGMLCAGLSGPRRASAGALRDFVLGAVLMDGRGQTLRFGGQVMKNVAGYDVSRLLAGSMGTLGLVLECSLKVLPLPMAQLTLCFAMSEIDALRCLNEWAGQPLPITASCWHAGQLHLRLAGAQAAVRAARTRLGGELVEVDGAFWHALREQQHPFFAAAPALWRLSLPSATSALVLRGEQLIEWGGAQRWLAAQGDAQTAARIRAAVQAAGGHATLFRGGDKSVGVFQPLASAVARIHERLRASFDPASIFNPARMG